MQASLLRAGRQGKAGYEAAKGDVNRHDRNMFNRHSDATGNKERPLRGANPNWPDGGRCLRRLRRQEVRVTGLGDIPATPDVSGILNAPILNPHYG